MKNGGERFRPAAETGRKVKILVLQLARLGDILQTWPVLAALNRQGHDVHVMVRPRFKAALEGAPKHKTVLFETARILNPLITRDSLAESLKILDETFQTIESEKFDRVVNLSFSPLSSWLVREIACRVPTIEVAGYSRHSDGALAIPDDGSAYFYAQVGVNFAHTAEAGDRGANRIALPHLFGAVAGVELTDSDWAAPTTLGSVGHLRPGSAVQKKLVVHIGASESHKSIRARDWARILAKTFELTDMDGKNLEAVLVGSTDEVERSNVLIEALSPRWRSRVHSLVGKTTFRELWSVVNDAELLLGGDSVVAQMASLAHRPMVNLSSPTVSHWETGPLSSGSRIIVAPMNELDHGFDEDFVVKVASECRIAVSGDLKSPSVADRQVRGPVDSIVDAMRSADTTQASLGLDENAAWKLAAAVYLGGEWPSLSRDWLETWTELAGLDRQQIQNLLMGRGDQKQTAIILQQVDSIATALARQSKVSLVLAAWWQTEKIRVPPGDLETVARRFLEINTQLMNALDQIKLQSKIEMESTDDRPNLDI